MKKENTALRLKYIMKKRSIRQIDILNLCRPLCENYGVKMNKSDISQYIAGKTEPGQDKLYILGCALNVSEAWLMGYDVPMESMHANNSITSLTDLEQEIIKQYRQADDVDKEMVHRILNIKEKNTDANPA